MHSSYKPEVTQVTLLPPHRFGSWLVPDTVWVLEGLILLLDGGLHIAQSIAAGICIGVSDGTFMRSNKTGLRP
jgi:hypothetical protein